MGSTDMAIMERIARRHDGRPENVLMKMALIALKAVDTICGACQGKLDPSLDDGVKGVI